MKKKCKAHTQSKFFNETIAAEDLMTSGIITSNITTPNIINLTTNIPSREDIVLTRSRSSTRVDDNNIDNNNLKQQMEKIFKIERFS